MIFGFGQLGKCLLPAAAGFILCTFSACSIHEAWTNNDNLKQVRVGMTKDQVRKIMGAPLEKEVYSTPDIWFYFTGTKCLDGVNTRDECTPLLFDENGQLKGWGYDYYKSELGKDPFTRKLLDSQL